MLLRFCESVIRKKKSLKLCASSFFSVLCAFVPPAAQLKMIDSFLRCDSSHYLTHNLCYFKDAAARKYFVELSNVLRQQSLVGILTEILHNFYCEFQYCSSRLYDYCFTIVNVFKVFFR